MTTEYLPISLGFDSVGIVHKKNICKSRLDVNISSEIIRGIVRPIPLIAANMLSVINSDFYKKIYSLGGFAILHRAHKDPQNRIDEVANIAKECEWVATSVGIGSDEYEIAWQLIEAGANILTIDIANGYCDDAINFGRTWKSLNPNCKIIIGNTANIGLLEESADFADAVKVGIANGLSCETKNTAGCNEKQFSTVLKFKERSKELGIPIISDGSIKEPADFTKAIGAGANSVMAGSIFAKCPESAATVIDGKKIFAGMASRLTQELWRGMKPGTCPEGGIRYLEIGESVDKLLERYSGALKSGITYAGGKDINSFQDSVEFVKLL